MLRLELTTEEFTDLHRACSTLKAKVTVPVDVLKRLLRDHSGALAELQSHSVEYRENIGVSAKRKAKKIKL